LVLLALAASPLLATENVLQGAARKIRVGPFVSPADGVTAVAPTIASLTIDLYQPPQYATIVNQVTNGTFTGNANNWTLGTGTIYSANALSSTTSSVATTQQISCIQNVSYKVSVGATRSAGSFTVSLGGGTASASHASTATFADKLVCGATGLLALTPTGFTGTWDDITVEQWPSRITAAASGSVNDMVLREGAIYELELTATQLAIAGDHSLCFSDSATYVPFCKDFQVVGANGLQCVPLGNCATDTSIWSTLTSNIVTAGSIGKRIVDDLDATISGVLSALATAQSDITRLYIFKGNADKTILVGPFVSATTHLINNPVTTGTPSCTMRSDTSTMYAATGLTLTPVDSNGVAKLTIQAAQTNGKLALTVKCQLTNADAIAVGIVVQ
jgi:hypothetical protein